MTEFTPKQAEMLDALQEEFNVPEATFGSVSRYYKDEYGKTMHNWLVENVLTNWARHKLSQTVDWEEIDRLQKEEALRKLAERAEPIRANIVGGAFNQLLARVRVSELVQSVQYEMEGAYTSLIAYDKAEREVFSIIYTPDDRKVLTILGDQQWNEDVTNIHGSASPRTQLVGLDALLKWLDGKHIANS